MAFPKYLEDNNEIVTDNIYNTIRTNIFADCSYNKKTNKDSESKVSESSNLISRNIK